MPEKATLGCRCVACSQVFVSPTEAPATMLITYEDPAKFWAIVLAASTWCEWIKQEVTLPPLPHLRNRICAPLGVLNDYPWSKGIKYGTHFVSDKEDEEHIDVSATWASYRQTAQEKIGSMESSKRRLLLGELFCALSQQQAAIWDGVDEEEKMEQESDGTTELRDYVAQRRYTMSSTQERRHWWIYQDEADTDTTWYTNLAAATTSVLAPAVMAWKDQSSSREGLCAVCKRARGAHRR